MSGQPLTPVSAASVSVTDLATGFTPSLRLDGDGVPTTPMLVVDLAGAADMTAPALAAAARALDGTLAVTVGVGAPEPLPALAPVVDALTCTATPTDLATIVTTVAAAPLAAVTFAGLLRQTAALDVRAGLLAESAAYSTLLAGPEFARWLAHRDSARPLPTRPPVRVDRVRDRLLVTLDRPERRNAVDRTTRDALADAFRLALADPSLVVELSGAGPHFSSGGDLDEFGTAPDPAVAHVVRSEQSVGWLIHQCRDRVRVRVHGACIGAGVEIPAFAGYVSAAPDATFALPELGLGLLPGAGGTVSITRRIGRARTAWLGLTRHAIDAPTALAWGLVDVVQ